MAESEDLNQRFARYRISPRIFEILEAPPAPDPLPGAKPVSREVEAQRLVPVIVELNADFEGGVARARDAAAKLLAGAGVPKARMVVERSRYNIFARLTRKETVALAEKLREAKVPPIYKVWPDEKLKPLLNRSARTIKADACLAAFGADGEGIVWAVADSGIDRRHPHFLTHNSTDLPNGLEHKDFTVGDGKAGDPLSDGFGHGTHVAGIIAGDTPLPEPGRRGGKQRFLRLHAERDAGETVMMVARQLDARMRGIAPKAKLLSLKIMDDEGGGEASTLIAALEWLEGVNDYGRRIRVHGVNLSVGHRFDATWFAAGHSPLCAAVDRLSRAGVVVVAAAGNDGSANIQTEGRQTTWRVGIDQSINDPGNADAAITVGATHAEEPHRYGVSYFSSRGPTADGRMKPDLVAPGERIVSCAARGSRALGKALGEATEDEDPGTFYFREESGTSMAAPHVSGAAAALLSVRKEFIGRPEAVKAILTSTCTDLKRRADYQGAGLLDLMRAIQSV